MASSTSHIPLTEPCIWIKISMPYGVASLGCPWCSSMWFKRLGDCQNHLFKVHDGMLRQAGINLTMQTNTSTAINPPPGNPTSFQLGNMGVTPGHNSDNSIPISGSSKTPAFPISNNPFALQSPQFKATLPPQFSPQPRFSSQIQQSIPAPRSTSIHTSGPPPPSYCAPSQGPPPNGAFQPNNRVTSTVNAGIPPPFTPPLPSNNQQGNATILDSFDPNQWLSEFQMRPLE
ncbi:hypothetical protein F5Y00DRAFT_241291 [Daldinia vernicosa]|uniref:uncharacterized protein n=1 Tax=Daldinia vernicosa TaxID=114800 RepID=UPI002007B3D0|nr:uncharacterized protein F5Y00DRAFT_241291 [Daldinia vernicosa]KAI0847381.1 hypothetical protein F5Y00DRAFT_241291 [Daldinia vernicosa]